MDAYQANDIKYRHLRLQGNGPIQDLLYETDSLYQVEAEKMKRSVSHEEEARQRRMELRLEADRKEQEARQLREEARCR